MIADGWNRGVGELTRVDPLQEYLSKRLYAINKTGFTTLGELARLLAEDIKAHPKEIAEILMDAKVLANASYLAIKPHVHEYRWNINSPGRLICVANLRPDYFGGPCDAKDIEAPEAAGIGSMLFLDMPKYEGELNE